MAGKLQVSQRHEHGRAENSTDSSNQRVLAYHSTCDISSASGIPARALGIWRMGHSGWGKDLPFT